MSIIQCMKKFYEHYNKYLYKNQHLCIKNDKNFLAVFTKKNIGDIIHNVSVFGYIHENKILL